MDYFEAIEYIHNAPKISKKLGNSALVKALELFGSPHNELKFIHVAGTNGKGSTSAMLESILSCAGYKTGMFISPYIERFNERIQINSISIGDNDLARITTDVKRLLVENNIELSEFAIIFLVAMIYFKENQCDIIVLETGLGGRLDATNSIKKSEVSVITSVSYDHMQYLGDTIEQIAFEKCGIIKSNGTVVLYNNPSKEVLEVVNKTINNRSAELIVAKECVGNENEIVYDKKRYILSLHGEYQYSNASVCLEVINVLKRKGYVISDTHIEEGLIKVKWPGRFEWLNERLLLDGCHNEEGAQRFVQSVNKLDKNITIVTGVMADKDYESIAQILSRVAHEIIVTKPDVPRALEPSDYAEYFKKAGAQTRIIESPVEAVNYVLENTKNVCAVCGSLYLIGEVRSSFKEALHNE